ncbi:F-box/kelch-repeat protein At1g22040-like [Durio zibethinus]|uniref:F-box/kelch-repeat protein At1g22040-like n=1 Tax=Durio zibethinus TaxID=66656 RepID=A0A6P6B7M6_DURZI|nr:F-box/kelch-repeat protein At1g22040-like [Durio zibethinus]XP_022773175.1 F-box/kelch-repeat protein At1g22040-like [Durio zibethinus]XP_022773177.1 F-box/kelch-repeat protein At1g22040-like [Durio zibethinus]XP_022773178.1 F-box/kelch-repeat protein At1g22040-like [Durio zibethinus]
MGAILSLAAARSSINDYNEVSPSESSKKLKMSSCFHEDRSRLIPSLPDELSMQILARIPRIHYFNLRLVSQKWKATVMSPQLFKLRKELGMTEEWLYVLTKVEGEKLLWHALDPLSRKWQRLPSIPNVIFEEESRKSLWNIVEYRIKIAEFIRGWLGHKDGSNHMQFCGCAIGAVDGSLYVLGGFSRDSTMRNVWRFDPLLNAWTEVTSMSIGRAYCKTSILDNKLYVVGGVSLGRSGLTPLQSAEVFDPHTGTWSQVPSMPCSTAHMLPNAFLADMLKPIATGMTSYMGRLYVAQSLYSWPLFLDAGGEIYDPETNSWADMPSGMGEGWPARQAGTKLSVVVDGELYACDLSSPLNSSKIKVYDQKEDAWKVVIGNVPINDFSNLESPYLLAGFHGRLHVITRDANHDIAVLQADPQDNFSPLPSNSTSLSGGSLQKFPDSVAESETVIWKVIATRDFGSAELVSCQVLDI